VRLNSRFSLFILLPIVAEDLSIPTALHIIIPRTQ
jgi:hypothetical protein